MAEDPTLGRADLAIGLCLIEMYNDQQGCAWPSYDHLAERIHVHRKSAIKSVRRLVDARYFEVVAGGGRGRSNRYRPVLKTGASAPPFPTETVTPTPPFEDGETVASAFQNGGVFVPETVASTPPESFQVNPSRNPSRERVRSPKGTRLAEGTLLPEGWKSWAIDQGHPYPDREWEIFHDYWIQQPGQKGLKADWHATWRTWIRRDLKGAQGNGKQHRHQNGRRRSAHQTLFEAGAAVAGRSRCGAEDD